MNLMPVLSLKQWLIFTFAIICILNLGILIGFMGTKYSISASAQEPITCTGGDQQYNQTVSNPLFYSKQNQSLGQIVKISGNILTIRRLFMVRGVEASDPITIIKGNSNSATTFASLDKIELDRYAMTKIAMVGCRLKVVSINYMI